MPERRDATPRDLERYDAKRDFSKTPEPSGAARVAPDGGEHVFVIQKHRASHLHYDFRLETDGVLKSWAIPKGPSLDPKVKRFAAEVEDHPYDYRDFEGTIPAGNYGAGEVIVWDRGTYRLTEGTDLAAEIARGSVKFALAGEKLHGGFALVKMKGRGAKDDHAWLLIKERDDAVDPAWSVEEHGESVLSGREIAELATPAPAVAAPSAVRKADVAANTDALPPPFEPMLATSVDAAFDDERFLFEIKWDGYRALARIAADGSVVLQSRGGIDFTPRLEEFAYLAESFSERPLIVDGEIVVLGEDGRASFGALQERLDRFGRRGGGRAAATYVVFDCLYAGGKDLRSEPLERRKAVLAGLLTGRGPVMLSAHVEREGAALFALAAERGVEGIVGKRRDSPYVSRRTRDWVKIKTSLRQEFVIGGWTEGKAGRKHLGALALGVHDDGGLRYVGSVGSGFDAKGLAAMRARLDPLARERSPFTTVPKTATALHFVEPELVAEVSFAEWSRDGQLRQPVFLGLRDDKPASAVVRERAVAPPAASAEPAEASAGRIVRTQAKAVPPRTAATPHGAAATETIGGHSLKLTNPDKILFPACGVTKGELVAYYRAVAPWIVPHLANRPLTLERFPNGVDAKAFFEKQRPRGTPEWIPSVAVPSGHKRESIDFLLCNDEASLAYLANLGSIVLHVWTSHVPDLDRPEFVFFDLDPWEGSTLATLAKTALGLRHVLTELGLDAVVKTSGGTGLHVAIPLEPVYAYDDAKLFAELVARRLHAELPALTTLERMTAKRAHGTVYLDYVQVGKGKTLVSAYSVRATPLATVSMPIPWSEVETMARSRAADASKAFARYTVRSVPALLRANGDAWDERAWRPQRLEAALAAASERWSKTPGRARGT